MEHIGAVQAVGKSCIVRQSNPKPECSSFTQGVDVEYRDGRAALLLKID